MLGASSRYHVDVAVVGSGLGAMAAATQLQARGVRVGFVGDPLAALQYEFMGMLLPKRSLRLQLADVEGLAELLPKVAAGRLGLARRAAPEMSLVAAHGRWPLDATLLAPPAENDPRCVFLPKLSRWASRSAMPQHHLAAEAFVRAQERARGDGVLDLPVLALELMATLRVLGPLLVETMQSPAVSKLGGGGFSLLDERTGRTLSADRLVWEGDARAFSHLSRDAARLEVRAPRHRVSASVAVRRRDEGLLDEALLVAPADGGPLVVAESHRLDDQTSVWWLCTDAAVQDLQVRSRLLDVFENHVRSDDEQIVLADSAFDGLPVQLLDGGQMRRIERAELRARGLRVEADPTDLKYVVTPHAPGGEQAHPGALKDLPVHFVGPAVYPELGGDGEVRAAREAVDRLAPVRRKGGGR